ncbi:MAG TPA: H-X9-DG-CTERM domain-containing protein [Chthoniobacteraceae bacterium]|nr:H-X9-DG-CTERM domain-containing protein [Chthoniobacteraceae bacterium]
MPELLLVLALLAALAVIAALQVQRAGKQAVEIKCAHRLRQIGVLFHGYVSEQPNRVVRLFQEGTTTQAKKWYDLLQAYASLSDERARECFGCPALPADEVTNWKCYGFRVGGPPGEVLKGGGKIYQLTIPAVENPSKVLLAADTYSLRDFTQIFRIVPPKLYNSHAGIHLRHSDRANVLFLDGHVRALTRSDLHEVGIDEALDRHGALVETR